MTPVNREELPGMEFDWIAQDDAGHLAQMQAAGFGEVPGAALVSEELLFELHLFLDELPLNQDLSIEPGSFDADLADAQRRGLSVYDASTSEDGAYRRVALASPHVHISALPEHLRAVVARVPGRFEDLTNLHPEP